MESKYRKILTYSFGMLSHIQRTLGKNLDELTSTAYKLQEHGIDMNDPYSNDYDEAIVFTKEMEVYLIQIQKICQSVLNKKYKINGRPQSFVNYIQLFGVELQKVRKQQPYKVRKKRSKKPGLSTVMEFGGRRKSRRRRSKSRTSRRRFPRHKRSRRKSKCKRSRRKRSRRKCSRRKSRRRRS